MGETVAGFSVLSWFAVYGPKGMSPELTKRINEEIIKVAEHAGDGRQVSRAWASSPGSMSPAEFAAYVVADSARWGKLVKERNIKLD